MAAEPTADCSFEELARIVDENCEPFESLAQVNRFIKAAAMYRRREPAESENNGERITKRDLESMLVEARKAQAVFQMASGRTPVIVPTDCLL